MKSQNYSAVILTLLSAATVFGIQFELADTVQQIGPVRLVSGADHLSISRVKAFGGRTYWSLVFSDKDGDLGQFASLEETQGKCAQDGFCRIYSLTSGNANGKNVDPKGTVVLVDSEGGVVTITDPATLKKAVYGISAGMRVFKNQCSEADAINVVTKFLSKGGKPDNLLIGAKPKAGYVLVVYSHDTTLEVGGNKMERTMVGYQRVDTDHCTVQYEPDGAGTIGDGVLVRRAQ